VEDILLFIGGFHTSAYYLTLLFWYLARDDLAQEKLQDEIEKEVGDDRGDRLKNYTLKSKT
jgi:cytochrome P450